MSSRSRIVFAMIWALSFLVVAGLGAVVSLSKRDADRLQGKITKINENARSSRPVPLRTPVSEAEVNSYLTYALADEFPAGVTDPYVSIEGPGRFSARAVVDLNQVKAERSSGGWLDPLAYLGGKAPVTAIGRLHTSRGTARLELESTTISDVPVPKFLLQVLVSYYTRSAENPDGISLDESFNLPARIKEIELGKGEAVVVQ